MFTVWQLLADIRAGKTISLVKSHATICFASYSAWQTRITRSPADITLLWYRIQSFSEIENNKFVYGLQNWFVFVVALILDESMYFPWNKIPGQKISRQNIAGRKIVGPENSRNPNLSWNLRIFLEKIPGFLNHHNYRSENSVTEFLRLSIF